MILKHQIKTGALCAAILVREKRKNNISSYKWNLPRTKKSRIKMTSSTKEKT
jgi:hypothetical protein